MPRLSCRKISERSETACLTHEPMNLSRSLLSWSLAAFALALASLRPAVAQIYVINSYGHGIISSVISYSASANGNATPTATIIGGLTLLDEPAGIAIDASPIGGVSDMYVANYYSDSVTIFHLNDNGNVA